MTSDVRANYIGKTWVYYLTIDYLWSNYSGTSLIGTPSNREIREWGRNRRREYNIFYFTSINGTWQIGKPGYLGRCHFRLESVNGMVSMSVNLSVDLFVCMSLILFSSGNRDTFTTACRSKDSKVKVSTSLRHFPHFQNYHHCVFLVFDLCSGWRHREGQGWGRIPLWPRHAVLGWPQGDLLHHHGQPGWRN